MADYNIMSQLYRQQGLEVGGAPRMSINHSQCSHSSQESDSSTMSTQYSVPSPNTDNGYYNNSPFEEELSYSSTQNSQYGGYDNRGFQQYDNNHHTLSAPRVMISSNHWSPPSLPVATHHLVTGAYPEDHVDLTYQASAENTRHTIKSLQWNTDTRYLDERFYKFVVNKGKDPWFQLIDPNNVSPWTPFQVFLSDPFPSSQKSFPCAHPFPVTYPNKKPTCPKPFGRRADLERHYYHVHKPTTPKETTPYMSPSPLPDTSTNDKAKAKQEGDIYVCDRKKCSRDEDCPLGRKDHFRDHLRDFHKEDLGREKVKKNVSKEVQAQRQMAWEMERAINPLRWRCNKCLKNNRVRVHGWRCGGAGCKVICETKRREVREKMLKEQKGADVDVADVREEILEEQESADMDVVDMDIDLGDERVCNTCSGSGRYYNGDCPDCGPDHGPDGVDGQESVVYGQHFEAGIEMRMYDGDVRW